ncbi:MAG: hypothetical protein CM1200mP27_08950 [Chloroflexota bacterium]|nr:MAG: hypothetical protein CM1200mP27_08950 [Chloroflexota bacterium]
MPWDGTELWTCRVDDFGRIEEPQLVAGGKAESIFQPEWSPDNVLHFVSDRSGWWNIYRYEDGRARKLTDKNAELVNRSGYWGLVLTHSRPRS